MFVGHVVRPRPSIRLWEYRGKLTYSLPLISPQPKGEAGVLYSSYIHLSRTLQDNKSVKLYILEGYYLKGKRGKKKKPLSNNVQLLII